MSYLGNSDISEKRRTVGTVAFTLGAMTGTSVIMDALGLGWCWVLIERLPFWSGLCVCMALWGAAMLALLHGPQALMALPASLARHAAWGLSLLWRALVGAARCIGIALSAILSPVSPLFWAVAGILEPFYLGLLMVAAPLLAPLAPTFSPAASAIRLIGGGLGWCWQRLAARLRGLAASAAQRWGEEQILWRAYSRDFRGRYASYWEFRRAFEQLKRRREEAPGQAPPAPADPFADACVLLGLRADGNFPEAEFKAAYRASIKASHPDLVGPNDLASRINAASVVIKKRKGWL